MIKKKRTKDPNEPVGKLKQVQDFLPPPQELIYPEPTVKVTLSLTRSSLEFFRTQAKQHHTKYQRMIREVVDLYARQYQD